MKTVELDQNSPEWLKWRQQGIGASDAVSVMGDSPWTSRDELIGVKLGQVVVEENEKMARGRRLEPEARRMYEQIRGIEVRPVCAVHDTYPWLRASLDGLSLDGKVVLEIKCPGYWPHWRAVYRGAYPRYYRAQIQWQLLVTGAEICHYFSYRPDDPEIIPAALVEILPEPEYQEVLLRAGQEFMTDLERAQAGDLLQPLLQPSEIQPLPKPKRVRASRRK